MTPKNDLINEIISQSPADSPSMSDLPKRALVVLSGGQDSTTCLFLAKARGYELHAVTFDYGQRHKAEIESAKKIAELAGVVSHEIITLPEGILASTSPLVDSQAELEQYKDAESLPGGLEKTFVPFRNQLFLTIAANRAYAKDINVLVTGVCQEDSGGYPDCRDDFIEAFAVTAFRGTFCEHPEFKAKGVGVIIWTPLMYLTKAESVEMAYRLPGAYTALAYTHTSYDGNYPPTGKDHATLLRAKGFAEANRPDPLVLRAASEDLMEVPQADNYTEELVAEAIEKMDSEIQEFGWDL